MVMWCVLGQQIHTMGGIEQTPKLSGFINERAKGGEEKRKIFPEVHGSLRKIYAKSGNGISLKW